MSTATATEWKGTQQLSSNTCGQVYRVYCCCAKPDQYSITDKRLLIESEDGGCKGCLCGKTLEKDNTQRANITDVDITKKTPGCFIKLLTCCMANNTETVTIATTGNSGRETKVLILGSGKGEVVRQILHRD